MATEISDSLQATLNAGRTAYFAAGEYTLRDVILVSDAEIVAERGAIFRGSHSAADMFIAKANTWQVSISGGEWKDCDSIIRSEHTVSASYFTEMAITGTTAIGFNLDGSTGNTWTRCRFRSADMGCGVKFTGAKPSSLNTFRDCAFRDINGKPAHLIDGSYNSFLQCWVEDNEEALTLHDQSIATISSYFEKIGTAPDLHITGESRMVVIANCKFGGGTGTGYRVEVDDDSHVTARDNFVQVPTNVTFVKLRGSNTHMSIFRNNYLRAIGVTGGDYADRLFNTIGQPVDYDICIGSESIDGATDTDYIYLSDVEREADESSSTSSTLAMSTSSTVGQSTSSTIGMSTSSSSSSSTVAQETSSSSTVALTTSSSKSTMSTS
jgi:hypothetical protein